MGLLALSSGCGGESSAGGQASGKDSTPMIAVVDINKIASDIGATTQIDHSLADFRKDLGERMAKLETRLTAELEARKSAMNSMDDQARNELAELSKTHQQSIAREKTLANQQLASYHNQLKIKLMNEIRPVAYQIATEQGMSMVLTTSQVYAAGPTSDISNAVAKRINQMMTSETEGSSEPSERVAELQGGGQFKPY